LQPGRCGFDSFRSFEHLAGRTARFADRLGHLVAADLDLEPGIGGEQHLVAGLEEPSGWIERFGIDPTPLRLATQTEKSVINAYFAVAIEYGDRVK